MSSREPTDRRVFDLKKLELLRRELGDQKPRAERRTGSNNNERTFPLLPSQERLLVIENLYNTEGAYNIAIFARVDGGLVIDYLKAAFRQLAVSHDALRLSVTLEKGVPLQSFAARVKLDFEHYDFRSSANPGVRARRLAESEAARSFDLSRPPLWRVRLYRTNSNEYRILLCLHHIIADGGSLAVIMRDLAYCYKTVQGGSMLPPETPPIDFANFVESQQRTRHDERAARSLVYWSEQLRGVPDHITFPQQREPSLEGSFRGGRQTVEISENTTKKLKRIGRQANATLFMVLLAAYEILLHRLIGQSPFLVGVPVANRRSAESQDLVGFFVNTLPFRVDITEDMYFGDLLSRTRNTSLEAFEHQDAPFSELVKNVNPERDLDRQPLAQLMFVLQNTSQSKLLLPDVEIEILPFHNGTSKFDLLLDLHPSCGGLSGYFEYRSAVFGDELAEQMVVEFQNLLEEIPENADRKISELASVCRHALSHKSSLTSPDVLSSFSIEHTLHGRFTHRARMRPDTIALSFEGHSISYRVLDRRSDQLAKVLRRRGVRREDKIGVFLERSPEMVIALLATLKSGAAYVPLDPVYPSTRLRHILEAASCRVVLSDAALANLLPKCDSEILFIARLFSEIDGVDPTPAWAPTCPDSLAYIVFTSGSTGAPKGVLAHHRGALNHLDHVAEKHGISEGDVVLQTASLISDASIEDLLGALLQGARVVLIPQSDARDPTEWLTLIERERVTAILASTPRFLGQLGRAGLRQTGDYSSLRLIFANGEPLTYEDCAIIRQSLGDQAVIVNQYGPTEASITASEFAIDSRSPTVGRAPLGEALSNVDFYLLDSRMRMTLEGVPGEVFIGGVGLAHGYYAQPALTAASFVPNPFSSSLGSRIYRTGDRLVSMKAGGFHFVGRVDHQIKIRGYRIEPGEIEKAINACSGVVASLVTRWADPVRGDLLVAYFVIDEAGISTRDLRESLKIQLPRYMVPGLMIKLGAMPLTPNGKIDRSALPDPAVFVIDEPDGYVEPADPEEATLAELFEAVLGRRVGRHDNFFDIGGHSLAAVRLVWLVADRMNRDMAVRDIFLNPTVAELISSLRSENIGDDVLKKASCIRPSPTQDSVRQRNSRFHRSSLLEQIRCGDLGSVDAVAISTLPDVISGALESESGPMRLGRRADVVSISDTEWGRIASVWMPIYERDIYIDKAGLMDCLYEALSIAREIGASTAALTGRLGSATGHGVDLLAGGESNNLHEVKVTTGHPTTVASVLLAIDGMLTVAGRRFSDERVAILGLGSIGSAVVETLLSAGHMPQSVLLCDVYSRREALAQDAARLSHKFGRDVDYSYAPPGEVPAEAYEATMLIGATNVPNVLDVSRLAPGTVIIDDSAPYCFDQTALIGRIAAQGDVLATTGGLLRLPSPIIREFYLPGIIENSSKELGLSLPALHPDVLPACAMSALLLTIDKSIEPTLGCCKVSDCLSHLEIIRSMQMTAPGLQLSGTAIDREAVGEFRKRFGNDS